MKNRLCSDLNIEYPIIGGAMTGFSNPVLTAAISEAGGFGVYAAGLFNRDIGRIREDIQECKRLTKKPFGINVPMASPIVNELMEFICTEEIAAVTTGAGSPKVYLTLLKEAGVKVMPVISTPEQAKKMEKLQVDAVIASGRDAGGIVGKMGTMSLVPAAVDAVNIPVIAAGGIADGRGMAAAFALGACGVQMGTRFMLSAEATLHPNTREYLLSRSGSDTVVLGEKIGSKVTGRYVIAPFVENVMSFEKSSEATLNEFQQMTAGRDDLAIFEGNLEEGMISAGMGLGLIHDILPCKEIILNTMKEFRQTAEKVKAVSI